MAYSDKLDVWSPQYNYKDITSALNGWKNEDIGDGETILFSNLRCYFNLGGKVVPSKQWDTFLYSPNNDKLVMLMRDGAVSYDDLKRELDNRGIIYHEVVFSDQEPLYSDDSSLPQFWTARDKDVLNEFIEDSVKNENSHRGVYYPKLKGSIELSYETTNKGKIVPVEGRIIDGVIVMEDKVILLLRIEGKSIHPSDVVEVLANNEIEYTISFEQSLDSNNLKRK